MAANNNYNYTFTFSLLNQQDPSTGLQVRYSGTMDLNIADPMGVTGTVTVNGDEFPEPIDLQGTAVEGYSDTGTLINASGSTSQAQFHLAFTLTDDGSAGGGDDTLIGGMTSLFDRSAEEWNPYIIQGVAPQGPF